MKKKLKRTKQCPKCPWKQSTDPYEIPNYIVDRHFGLDNTIAETVDLSEVGGPLHVMSCHEHESGENVYCVGWLMNQLGPGNNIPLRLQMMEYDLKGVELDGPQHDTFIDTLPKD